MLAAFGLREDGVEILLGDHDLAAARVDRDVLALAAGEVGADRRFGVG